MAENDGEAIEEMTETVRKALSELKEGLKSVYGDRLAAIILYGSVARGDYAEDSGVDVAVVLRGSFFAAKEINRISPIVSEIVLRYGITISVLPVPEDWWRERQSPLLINLRKDGIMLWMFAMKFRVCWIKRKGSLNRQGCYTSKVIWLQQHHGFITLCFTALRLCC